MRPNIVRLIETVAASISPPTFQQRTLMVFDHILFLLPQWIFWIRHRYVFC